ncbi:hypothetical protein IW262DRAFT_1298148 [Armillaria fumosa]|nr:hypothetical protein IW262DRAFT_1298148 [Armillaria fumosa]
MSGEPLASTNRPEWDSHTTRDLEDEIEQLRLLIEAKRAHRASKDRDIPLDSRDRIPFLGGSFLCYILAKTFSPGSALASSFLPPVSAHGRMLSSVSTLRISHLHDVIYYPSPEQTTEDLHQQLTDLKRQMEKREHTLGKVRWRMDDGAKEVYEYVDDVVEKSFRRHEKKCERQDQRVKDVEISVDSLRKV